MIWQLLVSAGIERLSIHRTWYCDKCYVLWGWSKPITRVAGEDGTARVDAGIV